MADRVEQRLGNYRLLRSLGVGGFAEVYLGEHVHLATRAAVKVLHAPLTDENKEKFSTEARTIARLIHPNIVRILEFGVEDDIPFLVMDYAPNGNLCQRHPRGIPLTLDIILPYVKQIAAALQYAHSQRYSDNRRLIHRDIKPENMLLGLNNEVVLSDFGIAVITHTTDPTNPQKLVGTPVYMAPEQFLGKPRRASDQYALGIVVYEWLTGSYPFNGSTTAVAYQHIHVPPPPLRAKVPSLSSEVEQVVLKALAKNPKGRFANVQEFALALEQAYLSSKLTIEESQPPGALYIYRGHSTPVKAVTWSPDGQRIASAGQDSTVQVWDATTGCNVLTYTGHSGTVNAVAWSPNGKYIASAGDDSTVQVWDAITGQDVFTYNRHSSSLTAIAWSPDGKRIASASQDGTVQVWDRVTSHTYQGHRSGVLALAWNPAWETATPPGGQATLDGADLVSGSLDKTVLVWNVATGNFMYIYRRHLAPVNALAWSPDGQHIVSAGDDKRVRVWHATTGQTIATYREHFEPVNALAWSPNGQYIVSASFERRVPVWNAAAGTRIFIYDGHSNAVHAVAWSPDGTRIASASADHTVQVWRVIS